MERYRKSMIADLNAAQAQLTRSEELYKDVWNSRLRRLCEYDPKIEEALPDNAWMMTLTRSWNTWMTLISAIGGMIPWMTWWTSKISKASCRQMKS